ncbi:hypothetical protein lerEdw1_016499, partial [Lerista edwardsae]
NEVRSPVVVQKGLFYFGFLKIIFVFSLQEPRPLYTKRCQYYSSGVGYLYDAYQTEVTCYTLNSKCQLKVKSNTCYCCDLYNCENSEHSTSYYEFLGVNSCQDVVHLYRLLWSSTILNIIGLFLGIVTAAILGAFKDMNFRRCFCNTLIPLISATCVSGITPGPGSLFPNCLQLCSSTTDPVQSSSADFDIRGILSFCSSCATLSVLSFTPSALCIFNTLVVLLAINTESYFFLQPASNFPATSSTDISLSDDTQPPSQSSSNYGLPPNAPPLYTPTYFLSGEKPPPYVP